VPTEGRGLGTPTLTRLSKQTKSSSCGKQFIFGTSNRGCKRLVRSIGFRFAPSSQFECDGISAFAIGGDHAKGGFDLQRQFALGSDARVIRT
jgi:hypothetical protein